jgi:hypothetical protein
MSQRVLIVIQAADKDAANAFAKAQIDPIGGDQTFCFGLAATGDEPATHYWCSTLMPDGGALLGAFLGLFPRALVSGYDADGDPGFPQRVLAGLGLKQVLAQPAL